MLAAGKALLVLVVHSGQRRLELVQARLVVVGVGRVDLGEGCLKGLGHLDHAVRVEPEVRVEVTVVPLTALGVLVVAVLVVLGLAGLRGGGGTGRGAVGGLLAVLVLFLNPLVVDEVGRLAQVHHGGAGADLLDGLVQGGLEAGDVGDDVRFAQLGGLLAGELEVVRLDVGGGHGGDLDELAANGLGQVLDRVEGRGDRQGLARGDRVRRRGV